MKIVMKIIPIPYVLRNNVLNNSSRCVSSSHKKIVHCNLNELKRATTRDAVHINICRFSQKDR